MNEKRFPPGMTLYIDSLKPCIEVLDDEQLGAILRALYYYHTEKKAADFEDNGMHIAFSNLRVCIDKACESYEGKCRGGKHSAINRNLRKNIDSANNLLAEDTSSPEYKDAIGIDNSDSPIIY